MNSEPPNQNNNERNDPLNQRRRSVFLRMRDVVLNNVPNEGIEGGRGGVNDLEANA